MHEDEGRFNVAVVIPVGAGREENLKRVLGCIERQVVVRPVGVVIVHDGPDAYWGEVAGMSLPVVQVRCDPKHEPGMEQPRNIGVAVAQETWPEIDHVWFLDSDVIVGDDCLEEYEAAWEAAEDEWERPIDRVLVGPYEWLSPGDTSPDTGLHNDPRWPTFSTTGPEVVSVGKLNDGLACFSGNIVWPVTQFTRIGGFWNDIHHGRCEDGEIGLRAVAHGVPISFAALARGYHVWHEINYVLATQRNARDVPMLNARHPWVEGEEVFVVEKDGRRFDQRCPGCGTLINTIEFWGHRATCGVEPATDLILPSGMPQ